MTRTQEEQERLDTELLSFVVIQQTHRDEDRFKKIQELITKGANVNARDDDGVTLLHLCHEPKVVRLLIANKADVNVRDNRNIIPLNTCGNLQAAELLIASGSETIGVNNYLGYDIDYLIRSKEAELRNNLMALTALPNDIGQLTTHQKDLITHLTAPKKAGNPLEPRDILNGKSLLDYMQQEKPNLLQFALEYHEDKIFNGIANPIEFNHSLEVMSLSTIIKNINQNNTLKTDYENAKSNLFLTNGSDFKQQQQTVPATTIQSAIRGHLVKNELNKAKTAATKIQALGRGGIVRQRNIASTGRFTI